MNGFSLMLLWPILHKAKMGAYTELYAGLSPDITLDMGGGYVVPWGRIHTAPRPDLGKAAEFREWCEKKTVEFR